MLSVNRDLIEYRGVSNCINNNFENFKQCNYEWSFDIPCQKPDVLDITVVEGNISILEDKIIKTITGESLEGQILTGYKLFITGDIDYKIQYTTEEGTQVFHETFPFGGFVALPKDFRITSSVRPSAIIEDILIKKINNRCIYSNITVLLVAYTDC